MQFWLLYSCDELAFTTIVWGNWCFPIKDRPIVSLWVSSGLPRSRCENGIRCTCVFFWEKSVMDKGCGGGKHRPQPWRRCDTCENGEGREEWAESLILQWRSVDILPRLVGSLWTKLTHQTNPTLGRHCPLLVHYCLQWLARSSPRDAWTAMTVKLKMLWLAPVSQLFSLQSAL